MLLFTKKNIFFSDGYTNERGDVNLEIYPATPGSLSIFVEKDGYRNFLSYIGVKEGSSSLSITEKSMEPSTVSTGDIVSLNLKIRNTGTDTLENLHIRAFNNTGVISFIDSTFTIAKLPPNEIIDINDSLIFFIPVNANDFEKFEIVLKALLNTGDTLLVDTVFSYIHRPILRFEFLADSAVSDTMFLKIALRNSGSYESGNVQLRLDPGNYQPILDSTSLSSIPPGDLEETNYDMAIVVDSSFDSVIHLTFEYHNYSFSDSSIISSVEPVDSLTTSPFSDGV